MNLRAESPEYLEAKSAVRRWPRTAVKASRIILSSCAARLPLRLYTTAGCPYRRLSAHWACCRGLNADTIVHGLPMRCLHPRYLSVVWTETWPSRNWICSSSPPARRH